MTIAIAAVASRTTKIGKPRNSSTIGTSVIVSATAGSPQCPDSEVRKPSRHPLMRSRGNTGRNVKWATLARPPDDIFELILLDRGPAKKQSANHRGGAKRKSHEQRRMGDDHAH